MYIAIIWGFVRMQILVPQCRVHSEILHLNKFQGNTDITGPRSTLLRKQDPGVHHYSNLLNYSYGQLIAFRIMDTHGLQILYHYYTNNSQLIKLPNYQGLLNIYAFGILFPSIFGKFMVNIQIASCS